MLEVLMPLEHSHTPLSEDKKALIRAEYNTLFLRGVEILKAILEVKIKSLKHINSTVWYKILTEPRYFSDIEEVCQYAFRFLLRDSNECTVESTIGDIDYVKEGKGT